MQKIAGCALILLCTFNSLACDICGCAASGNQLGILPQLNKHIIGVKYQYNHFSSLPHGSAEGSARTIEQFHVQQLWTRYVVTNRFHLFAFMPYKINFRSTEKGTSKVAGIGDAVLLTNFIVFNSAQKSTKQFTHALQISSGIKLPSGKSDAIQNGLMLHSNMQAGTGSYDIPVNLVYTLRYKSYGTNAEINFVKNGSNKQHFRFGNQSTAGLKFFVWKEIKKISILPHAGMSFENAAADSQNGALQDYTGGKNVLGNAGVDVYYKKIGLNFLFQKSVYQTIGDGHIISHPRLMTNLFFLF
jgi:hypothetical protein